MTMRIARGIAALLALVSAASAAPEAARVIAPPSRPPSSGTARPRLPNFVILIGDDVGRSEIGCYGHPRALTPNLDALAKAGERFDLAFLTTSSCSPSRCSILTGRYPHATGAGELHQPLPPDQVTLVDELRKAGYFTASVGKWHLGYDAPRRFERVRKEREGTGCDHWVEALRDRPRDRPFFFWLASNIPHRPFGEAPGIRPYRLEDVVVPPFLPDIGETRSELALYDGEIGLLDVYVGRVLAELESQGVAGRTFVLFLSDNGAPFPRGKVTLYDSGIATPFIVRSPGMTRPGGVCRSLVSAVDIAPTIVELAGRTPPPTMQGRSFAPLLSDPSATVRERVFAEHNWHDYTARERAVRTTRYKYIRNFYPDLPLTPSADVVATVTFQAMRRLRDQGRLTPAQQACFLRPRRAEELYDVVADPDEIHDLAGDKSRAAILLEMRRKLTLWQQESGDREPPARRPDAFDRETGQPLGQRPLEPE
jgi:N-sulfoglucosamine sulfohydrolase